MSLSVGSKRRAYRQASHSNVVTSVAFSPDGQSFVSGSWDGTVKLWDVSDGRPKLMGLEESKVGNSTDLLCWKTQAVPASEVVPCVAEDRVP